MKPEWSKVLLEAGAELEGERVLDYGNPELERSVALTGDVLCDLSHQGLIGAYGPETAEFLQGQLTVDVPALDPAHSHLGAFCNAKGRMLADFRIFRRGETWFLRLPREQVQPTLKRLSLFVLRAKVTLEDADDALVRFGLSGPHAAEHLGAALGGPVPGAVDDVVHHQGATLIRVPGVHPRFEIYGELEALTRLWEALNVRAAPVGAAQWALLDILAGVPQIHAENAEAFVPQMTNLQLLGGVSFNKGCYQGQEVVARMHYLGRLKRRMYRLHLPLEAPPPPGTALYDPQVEAEQPVGRIVQAQPHPDGGVEALAVLQIASAEGGHPRLGAAQGPAAEIRPLPYAFEAGAGEG
ncbi:YgfZ/GcvT domain-containing protein [Ectothiorhodospira mobilis]|uniref:CAF17-like 4Fe-4S cluster assembly/insertion protein YgfZ n=1 Tax=Ectothiorhodospira mobilis TaxID=195064 RepID=UPI001EE91EE8|nr:folate-binding protein [Ectothiorhodospira mobilis]MCG5535671.1 folate-binding protein [Ectothiorhodospira mobilis]